MSVIDAIQIDTERKRTPQWRYDFASEMKNWGESDDLVEFMAVISSRHRREEFPPTRELVQTDD